MVALKKNQLVLILLVLILLDISLAILFSLRRSLFVPLMHRDGAYQTASGLYRLSDGQWPGRDFFPYLGPGMLFLLFPIFKIAGGNVGASVFAAHFVVVCAQVFSIAFTALLVSRSKHVLAGVLAGSLVWGSLFWLYPNMPFGLLELFTPGISLRPLRAFLPYICACLAYLLIKLKLSRFATYGGLGAVSGMAFLWMTEFGLPASFLMLFFALVWAHRMEGLSFKIFGAVVGVAVLTVFLGLEAATLGHEIELLRYAFLDTPGDQYWYFGPWRSDVRIFNIQDIFTKSVFPFVGNWGFVWVGMAVFAYLRPSLEYALLLYIGTVLFGGGLLASIAGHVELGYLAAFIFWCKLTLILALLLAIVAGVERFALGSNQWRTPILVWSRNSVIFGTVLFLMSLALYNVDYYIKIRKLVQSEFLEWFYVPELGGYLPIGWRDHVNLARSFKESLAVEEYWGIWSSITHKYAPYPVDSVIHALGGIRDSFESMLEKKLPEYVVTSAIRGNGSWLGWNLSANWWFYKIVLENYEAKRTSNTTLLWKRSIDQATWPDVGCRIRTNEMGNPEIVIDAGRAGYYEVTLDYSAVELNRRTLFLVKNNLNFATYIDGYLSLDPRATESTFPVAVTDPVHNNFDFRLIGGSDERGRPSIWGCRARAIMAENPDVLPSMDPPADSTTVNLTDENWVLGVARNWPGFLVQNTEEARRQLAPGKTILFSDGYQTTIRQQEENGPHLYIFLEGERLDGSLGFPHQYKVLN